MKKILTYISCAILLASACTDDNFGYGSRENGNGTLSFDSFALLWTEDVNVVTKATETADDTYMLFIYDKDGNVETKIRSRGLFDTFILPYAYFLLNRKKYKIRCTTTVAQIADIPNHWQDWWNIGGVRCLIDQVNTTIHAQTGIGEVELTVYAL